MVAKKKATKKKIPSTQVRGASGGSQKADKDSPVSQSSKANGSRTNKNNTRKAETKIFAKYRKRDMATAKKKRK